MLSFLWVEKVIIFIENLILQMFFQKIEQRYYLNRLKLIKL